jgi:hypothetical protein
MKVKVTETKSETKEIDLEYPIYLYFQDELCHDELMMIKEDCQIIVKYDVLSLVIERSKYFMIRPEYIKNNLTTREHFLEVFDEAIASIKTTV